MSRILRISVGVVVLIIIGIVFYYNQSLKPKSFLDQSLLLKYKILNNESDWREKLVKTEGPEKWNLSEENTVIEVREYQYNFYCGDTKAFFAKYLSYSNPKYIGAWNNIYVVDCGSFYSIYEYGDAGSKLFGPFDFNK